MRDDVAALYVDPKGPYPHLVRLWFDEARDARTYAGPWPVVAHPPCGPWGKMRWLCKKQDKKAGPHAVEMVRRFGGVLEHPEHSQLWEHCGLPDILREDSYGGVTYSCNQVSWGHCCSKPTWLYMVGISPFLVGQGMRFGGTPTHRTTSGPGSSKLPSATPLKRRLTPPLFAEWLVSLAALAHTGIQ